MSFIDIIYKILYQNENEICLDVTGEQVVFRIETALNYWWEYWNLQDYTNAIISYKMYNIPHKMHLNQTELSLRTDVLTFEYITLSIQSSDQQYFIFVNSVNLLKNRFCVISEVLIVELLLITVNKINCMSIY